MEVVLLLITLEKRRGGATNAVRIIHLAEFKEIEPLLFELSYLRYKT